jgi:hypothetical protein
LKSIPAILRIDVEPDDFVPGPDAPPWTGFMAMAEFIERSRDDWSSLSGSPVHPTWFFRLDPDVERWYGRPDFAVREYGALVDRLRERGDFFGIHVHYYRWDDSVQASISEHVDRRWITHCIDTAVQSFEGCFGQRARRSSQGGFTITNDGVDRLIEAGIEVDVTPEPGRRSEKYNVSFGAAATAPSPDFTRTPRHPYYPSVNDPTVAGQDRGDVRPMLMVPLTAYDYERAMAPWKIRLLKAALRWPRRPKPLNPHGDWPDPRTYWDLVERAADEGPARYVALAVRTDAKGSMTYERSRALFEYLPRHAIATRLRFVDPLSPEIRGLANSDPATSR